MTNYREILRLDSLGIQKKDIAQMCGCSRNTVTSVLKKAKEKEIGWDTAQGLRQNELSNRLFPRKDSLLKMPDYKDIHAKLAESGVSLNYLWIQYRRQCEQSGERAYQKIQFAANYKKYVKNIDGVPRTLQKPGKIGETFCAKFSLCGTIYTTNPIEIEVFVSILPYSGYMYAEALPALDAETWTQVLVNTYEYFGGVPHMLIHNYPLTSISPRIVGEIAEHYKTVILPAQGRSRRNRIALELYTEFIAELKNKRSDSLAQLNDAIRLKLEEFNRKQFKGSRRNRVSVFEEEQSFFIRLPNTPFELKQKRIE